MIKKFTESIGLFSQFFFRFVGPVNKGSLIALVGVLIATFLAIVLIGSGDLFHPFKVFVVYLGSLSLIVYFVTRYAWPIGD